MKWSRTDRQGIMRKSDFIKRRVIAAALLAAILLSLSAHAQDDARNLQAPVDADILSGKLTEVEASSSIGEEEKATLVDLYRRALRNLERASVEQQQAAAFDAARTDAPRELDKVHKALADQQSVAELEIPASTPLDTLEESLGVESARLDEVETRLARLREQYASEMGRPQIARERLDEARDEQRDAAAALKSPSRPADSDELVEARRWHLETRIFRLRAEIDRLDQELLSHAARLELLEAEQEQAAYVVELARARKRALEEAIGERRRVEAELAIEEMEKFREALESPYAMVRELADDNAELSKRLQQLVLAASDASDRRDSARERAASLADELSSAQSTLAIGGLSQTLGQMLVEQRRTMPSLDNLRRLSSEREREAAEVGLEQARLTQERRALRNIESYVDYLTTALSAEEAEGARPALVALAASRQELVRQSMESGAAYLRTLGELDFAQRKLMDTVREYNELVDKRLLWVRNAAPINADAFGSISADVQRLISSSHWAGFVQDFATALRVKPLYSALLLVLLVLAILRRRFLSRVDAAAEHVGRIRTDRMRYSLEAFVHTALAAAPLPMILIVVGSTIGAYAESAAFSSVAAASLVVVGTNLLFIQFLADSCRDKGLATKHCRWTPFTVAKMRAELRWFIVVFPIADFIGIVSLRLDAGAFVGGLAVVGLTAAAASLGVFVFRLLRPAGGILRDFLLQRSDSLLAKLRPVWFATLTAIVPALIILWFTGYNYTADVLANIYLQSIWLVLWLMLLQGFIARWLLLGYQKLELKAAVERRDAAREARREAEESGGRSSAAADAELEIDEPEVDFAALGSNSRSLLRTIVLIVMIFWLWLIWSPIIPALAVLGDIALWTRMSEVNGESLQVPVTLADLLLTVVVGITAGAAARGLPSIVELLLMQYTKLTAGSRYTVTTLLRYTIIAVGTIIILAMLGGNWSQIQWLVAALGVGIGFGLQEIVANFISGLIILFERPVRIGDTVSVGETSGVVTQIRIRATTIRDWDRRELLVPNKEFVTGRLLNWTLSDTVVRALIQVGIEYGSDVKKALQLLESVAAEHEKVLDDPAPWVTFDDFGDSALTLTLRAYVGMEDRVTTASEIRGSIDSKFREAGIVIAFPQRDVHLDTSQPLEITMRECAEPEPASG